MIKTFFASTSALFLDLVETLVIGLSLFLVIYLFFMQPHQVSGQSMEPNLINNDYVLTDKVSYRVGEPERGDVVVIHAPEAANCPTGTGCDFIKRLIGLPGETVVVKDNAIYINGKKLEESYIPKDFMILPGTYTKNHDVVLGEEQYFVVGDNRMHSSDSRAWGPVSRDGIVGKAFFRYWPVQDISSIPDVSY